MLPRRVAMATYSPDFYLLQLEILTVIDMQQCKVKIVELVTTCLSLSYQTVFTGNRFIIVFVCFGFRPKGWMVFIKQWLEGRRTLGVCLESRALSPRLKICPHLSYYTTFS